VCKVQRSTQHIVGQFGDKSSQAIDCTATNNQITPKKKYTKQKITNAKTNKLATVKT